MDRRWASENPFTIVLPTLNEGENIVPMLQALTSLYPKASILVMDDNSRDGTADKVNEMAKQGLNVRAIVRDPSDKGLTASIFDGIVKAETDYFVVMDCDFQHPPSSVADLIDSMVQGSDLAIGVREDKFGLSSTRRFASWGANAMATSYLRWKRQPLTEDTMSGLFAGRTEMCRSIIQNKEYHFERRGFKALFDLLKFIPKGSKIAEVEFKFNSRRYGESKLSSVIILSIMRQCGIWGRGLAVVTSFFLTNMFGRYLTALILSLLFTFGLLSLTDTILTEEISNAILMSLLIAIGYLVAANAILFKKRSREGIIRGTKMVFSGFTGYLVTMAIFYVASSSVTTVELVALLIGFAIGFMWDSVGINLRK